MKVTGRSPEAKLSFHDFMTNFWLKGAKSFRGLWLFNLKIRVNSIGTFTEFGQETSKQIKRLTSEPLRQTVACTSTTTTKNGVSPLDDVCHAADVEHRKEVLFYENLIFQDPNKKYKVL